MNSAEVLRKPLRLATSPLVQTNHVFDALLCGGVCPGRA